MKKIAVALKGDKKTISEHFGTCESYMLFETEGEEIIKKEEVVNNPSEGYQGGCTVPDFINSLGASVIITGGMGTMAIEKCKNYSIEVILGNVGPAEETVLGYLKGEIKSVGDACRHHN